MFAVYVKLSLMSSNMILWYWVGNVDVDFVTQLIFCSVLNSTVNKASKHPS